MRIVRLLVVTDIKSSRVRDYEGCKRYIATGDVNGNKITAFKNYVYDSKPSRANLAVEKGQVLFAKMMNTNDKVLVINEENEKYIYSTGFCSLLPKEDMITSDFLRCYLISNLFIRQKDKFCSGATQKAIAKEGIKKINIPLLSLPTQKKIVQLLDRAQSVIDARKEQIKLLDDLVQSIFYDMFGDPVSNPKGWEKGSINDLTLKTQYGTSKKANENIGEFPVLRMNNITYRGNWDFSSLKYIDLDEKEKEKYLVHKGQLLFNRTNSKELVGKTAVYRSDKPIAYAGYLVKLIPNNNANSEYISAYLNSDYGKKVLLNMAKNIVGMANINAQELKKMKILLPPVSLQNQFANKVEKIENQKQQLLQSLQQLEDNFNSLMQRAFKGQLIKD